MSSFAVGRRGSETAVLEGDWTGDLVVVQFPSREQALGWYHSAPTSRSSVCAPGTPTAPSS
ncbi:DUF1330 domain-containing protein [Rhodococcus sp. PAM 2766]|uniref:DUF1330 domain-containing protein n=1 Tax=Rhodococcus parequi TaxID=3137122 RepID=A0ABW9FEI5_9NOCA